MNILIVFYGIGRGIELSEKSINSSLVKPLKKLGHKLANIELYF